LITTELSGIHRVGVLGKALRKDLPGSRKLLPESLPRAKNCGQSRELASEQENSPESVSAYLEETCGARLRM